jgi:c(7)-type cytochrome triheme protein
MRASTSPADKATRSVQATPAGRLARVAFCIVAVLAATVQAGEWTPLAKDGIHDPRSPAIKLLQEPAQALSKFTPDPVAAGNQVLWVQALDKKEIQPRERLFPKTEIRKLDRDSILNVRGGMPPVRFPHRQHTEWLDCVNCHDKVFSTTPGETKISMLKILEGEQCGICHGAVSFPLTECTRCHSIPRPGQAVPVIPPGVNPRMHRPEKQVP